MALWINKKEDKEHPEDLVAGMTPEMEKKLRERFFAEADDEPGSKPPNPDELASIGREVDRDKEREETLGVIDNLAMSLVAKRDKAITARASCGIEQIWREDELAFEGLDDSSIRTRMIDYATDTAPPKASRQDAPRSRVVINIIRPKCETAEGRFSDIELPVDGRNWGLSPTPVPEMMIMLEDKTPVQLKGTNEQLRDSAGKPQTTSDIASSNIKVIKDKMELMEKEIDDQLTQCFFNTECRKAIRSAIRLGTGVLKGPIVVKDLRKTWQKIDDTDGTSARVLKMEETFTPSSRSVDPWDVFPDPECRNDIKKAAYIWERETILPRELRNLVGLEGYLSDQIQQVLMEEPRKLSVAMDKENQYLIRYNTIGRGNAYEKWEYNGELNRDDMEALGIDCSSFMFPSVSANVIMINDIPIKVSLNPLDTGELPYDFFTWTTRAGIPWGMGVARELIWPQRVLIAAWRAMMDNAGDSAGANLGVGPGVEPVDGEWTMTGKKIWWGTEDGVDMRKSLVKLQVDNNQEELQAIIELALRFADMESMIPMIFQGEKGELPETLGATNILVDSNNVALRSRVKLWDDTITKPHIGRYYDWNMQYNEKDNIKGDFRVDAKGVSVLLERDQQGQAVKDILAMKSDPEIAAVVDWETVVQKFFAGRNLDIMLPPEKIAENKKRLAEQPPPMDPALEVAKLRADGELRKAQLVQEADMAELQFKAQQAELDRQHQTSMKLMERDMKAMELSAASGMALDKIKAELTVVSEKLRTQVSLATAKNVKPAEEVATPLAEPAQRAKPGHAFQD